MSTKFNLHVTAIALLIFIGCKRDENNCSASTGGSLTVVAFPQHDGKTIYNLPTYPDTVYVKFNTQDEPGVSPADYDTYFVGEAGENHVHIEGLKCGDYYFFAAGFDSTINQRVVGGIPVSTEKKEGEIDITIPVSD